MRQSRRMHSVWQSHHAKSPSTLRQPCPAYREPGHPLWIVIGPMVEVQHPIALGNAVEHCHLLRGELEVEELKVFSLVLRIGGARYDTHVALHRPAQQHLPCSLAVQRPDLLKTILHHHLRS